MTFMLGSKKTLTALALAAAVTLPTLPAAGATDAPVVTESALATVAAAPKADFIATKATASWGVKESFRTYLKKDFAGGSWEVSDGLTETNGTFNWSKGTGSLNRTTRTGTVYYPGTLHFTAHKGALDMTITKVGIRFDGRTSGTLVADITSKNMNGEMVTYTGVDFATIDMSGVRPTTAADGRMAVSVTNAPVTLTEKGVAAFADFYKAGTELDPISFSIPIAQGLDFTDVADSDQFAFEISWLSSTGITTGYEDGTYRPGNQVERGAMAAFFYRLAGSPEFTAPATPSFKDVPTSHKFYKEIEWMKAKGITTGYSDGTFRPDATVNRDAMAAFFYRLAGSPAYTAPANSAFTDIKAGDQFYKEVSWLASTGITTGWADGTFRPTNAIKRDAMAAFIYRYVHNLSA